MSCPADELLFGGAAGGGKSDFLLADFTDGIQFGKDHRGILFRRSYPQLEELISRSRDMYQPIGAVWHEQKRTWTFPGGATLKMRFLDSDTDDVDYQGHQYTWIGWDELTTWPTDYLYTFMVSRNRSPAGIPCRIRSAGNPGGPGHLWVKARFIDNAAPETIMLDAETGLTRVFIPAKLEDNQILMTNDPGYEIRMKLLPPHLYKALRDGDWNVFAGQIFEEFSTDSHVIKPRPLAPEWFRFAALDWGYAKPFSVGWWVVTADGRRIRYREWYGCEPDRHNVGVKMPAQQVAEDSFRMSVAEGCDTMVADPSIWQKNGLENETSTSIAEVFEAAGWKMVRGNNNRLLGLTELHNLMQIMGMDGKPMLQVFDTCRAFIRTVPALTADPKRPEDVDTAGEDHVFDESKYAVLYKAPVRVPRTRLDFHAHVAPDWNPLELARGRR